MTDTESTILKRVITDAGLSAEQAEHICLLLSYESKGTQQAFYYRCLGFTQAEIGDLIGVSQQGVSYLLSKEVNIRNYLKGLVF